LQLGGQNVKSVNQYKYLGITELSDDKDIQRQLRYQYCAANKLRASFSRCSNAVKNVLFRSFCTPMHASHLWCNFRNSCMQKLRVAYNFGCRALYNLPWRASVSSNQVQFNIPTFEALLRKYTYLFLERCRKSNNIWLRALMQSDCLYSSPVPYQPNSATSQNASKGLLPVICKKGMLCYISRPNGLQNKIF